MSRYIDADALVKAIENDCLEAVYYTKQDAIDCIQSLPAADVVEVVRCKDCKYWGGTTYGFICRRFSGITMKNCTKPDAFCSDGERRAEE
jgi:hypothetical protein